MHVVTTHKLISVELVLVDRRPKSASPPFCFWTSALPLLEGGALDSTRPIKIRVHPDLIACIYGLSIYVHLRS